MDRRKRKTRKGRKGDGFLNLLLVLLLLLAVGLAVPVMIGVFGGGGELILTVEAGSPLPEARDFLPQGGEGAAYTGDVSAVRMDVPGTYELPLTHNGKKYTAVFEVRDTVAPAATAVDVTVSGGQSVTADSFVTQVQDATKVSVSFEAAPDTSAAGTQTVTVVLTDLGGNTTRLTANLTVVVDTKAPQITGVQDLITAVTLEVDSSNVDLSTPGVYKVVYSATDAAGNTVQQEAQVTVLEKRADHVDIETIYAAVDAQLARFIREDMTDREKVEAIYVWTRIHFTYGGHTDTTDYIQSAYQFLTTRKGDCFGYFALQKLMLQRLGIPTVDVKKVKNFEGDSNHYWLLVSIDKGKSYYHMDNVWSKQLCLVTDAHLNAFSRVVKNCFNRDQSLYPPTPTEDLPGHELPWNEPSIVNAVP